MAEFRKLLERIGMDDDVLVTFAGETFDVKVYFNEDWRKVFKLPRPDMAISIMKISAETEGTNGLNNQIKFFENSKDVHRTKTGSMWPCQELHIR